MEWLIKWVKYWSRSLFGELNWNIYNDMYTFRNEEFTSLIHVNSKNVLEKFDKLKLVILIWGHYLELTNKTVIKLMINL